MSIFRRVPEKPKELHDVVKERHDGLNKFVRDIEAIGIAQPAEYTNVLRLLEDELILGNLKGTHAILALNAMQNIAHARLNKADGKDFPSSERLINGMQAVMKSLHSVALRRSVSVDTRCLALSKISALDFVTSNEQRAQQGISMLLGVVNFMSDPHNADTHGIDIRISEDAIDQALYIAEYFDADNPSAQRNVRMTAFSGLLSLDQKLGENKKPELSAALEGAFIKLTALLTMAPAAQLEECKVAEEQTIRELFKIHAEQAYPGCSIPERAKALFASAARVFEAGIDYRAKQDALHISPQEPAAAEPPTSTPTVG